MITGFGLFRSIREINPDPCVEINFTNNGSVDRFYEFTTCEGASIFMDLAPGETSINYCATDNSWVLDPDITVNIVRDVCENDGDVTTSPSPSPAPAPAPSPSPAPAPSPSPAPSPPPKDIR